jgi:hypothetical protein
MSASEFQFWFSHHPPFSGQASRLELLAAFVGSCWADDINLSPIPPPAPSQPPSSIMPLASHSGKGFSKLAAIHACTLLSHLPFP